MTQGLNSTAARKWWASHVWGETAAKTCKLTCKLNLLFFFACPCWSSAPHNTLGSSTFVGAVYKDILHQISRWSVSSIQHAVLCSLPVVHKMLHNIPVSLVCHISLWPAAHFPEDRVHKLSWALGLTVWEWSFMLTACAMHLYDLLLCRQLDQQPTLAWSPSPPCIHFIVKCCNYD